MIQAYLDESGIHESAGFCVVAGYFGGKAQWERLDQDWRKALAAYDVALEEFHALDFVKRRKRFYGWGDSDHRDLFWRLVTAITSYRIYPVSVGLVIEDFKGLAEKYRRFFTGAVLRNGRLTTSGCPSKPYFVPFQTCIKRVVSYAPAGGEANFFFGLDRTFAEYAKGC